MVRASMLEVLGESHVRTARAFGLSEWRITFRYALPIAVLPTVTILGVGIGYLISSAVFAEIVFSRPGIGSLIYEAVGQRNYPVVMGGVLITTVLFVVSTTIPDLVNAALDPRIREKMCWRRPRPPPSPSPGSTAPSRSPFPSACPTPSAS